jgi:hypothetical protein
VCNKCLSGNNWWSHPRWLSVTASTIRAILFTGLPE